MSVSEIGHIGGLHKRAREQVGPYITAQEKQALEEATAAPIAAQLLPGANPDSAITSVAQTAENVAGIALEEATEEATAAPIAAQLLPGANPDSAITSVVQPAENVAEIALEETPAPMAVEESGLRSDLIAKPHILDWREKLTPAEIDARLELSLRKIGFLRV